MGLYCTVSLQSEVLNVCIEQEDEEASTGSHLKLIVDAFIQQLPNCVNRDLIDKVRRTYVQCGRHYQKLFYCPVCKQHTALRNK